MNTKSLFIFGISILIFVLPLNAAKYYLYNGIDPWGTRSDGSKVSVSDGTIHTTLNSYSVSDEIWIAQGTYTTSIFPTAIVLKEGMKVYGGFMGSETSISQRQLVDETGGNGVIEPWEFKNPTIINGTGNAGAMANYVMFNSNTNYTLDGVTLDTHYVLTQNGGAIYNNATTTVIRNCIFRNINKTWSTASATGGGSVIYLAGSASITSCLFENNILSANAAMNSGYGGTIYAYKSATITRNVIRNNTVNGGTSTLRPGVINLGGNMDTNTGLIANNVIYNNTCSAAVIYFINSLTAYNIVNNTIVNNYASGGNSGFVCGIYAIPANAKIYNNVVYNNAVASSTVFKSFYSINTVDLQNCAYNGSTAGTGVFTGFNNNALLTSPNFKNPSTTIGYTAVMPADVKAANFDLQVSSTALIDQGNVFSDITPSIDFNGTVRNTTESGTIDIGAYECVPPLATPIVDVATEIGSAGFTANWTPVSNASGYVVNVYQGANVISVINVNGQSSAKIISGLASNTKYKYDVLAIGNGVTFSNSDKSVLSPEITTLFPKLTINTDAKLRIDSTNCYIIDNFLSNSWGNTTLLPGYGSTSNLYMNTTWIGATTVTTIPAMYMDTLANINGVALNYMILKGRTGNFDNHLGVLNLKDLYLVGNTSETYDSYDQSHVQSYLQLPTLPSVGKLILYVLPAYGSTGCVVESKQTDGSWIEVARFTYPIAAKYISLDTLANNNIISQTPVTYRIRSISYNSSTSHGYGPMLGAIMVQKYITNDIRPPYNDRPYYPNSYNTGVIALASSLVCTYNEFQWLDLVPTQAPRSLQFSPANVNNTSWTWDPATPNQITCNASGKVFPNDEYPISYASTKVMTGKIVNVPYYSTTKGVTYVQAQIDYQKTSFLTSNLPILSAAYRLTGDEKYARYVALALDKWANVVPDYFMTEAWNKTTLVDSSQLDTYRNTISFVQRASDHNGLAHEFHDGEILAYDGIYNSNALQALSVEKGYDVRQHISNDLFLNIALWLKDQPTMDSHAGTNLVGHIGTMLRVTAICADSLTKESMIDFVDRYYTVVIGRNFKRDGMFPESFSYHIGYADENYANTLLLDDYFKLFPPKTAFQDTIATRSAERVAFTKRTTLVQDSVAFPNGDLAPFDDTAAGYSVVRNTTKSYLLPAYSHAMLGAGTGTQQIQSNIGANDKANHIGNSVMSMTLYAFGNEQIGDIRYSRIPGRNFTNSVQAHNLVAIDQAQSQYYSSGRQVFGNDGHVFTNGYFTMFEDGMDGVSATEVYSNTIKPGTVSRYQRLHVLNTIDAGVPYLIDVFAVKGGTTHDYILNGSTQVAQTATSSLPLVSINNTYPLLPEGATYTDPIFLEDETNWYGAFRNMSTATSTGNWTVTFQDSLVGGIKVFAVDDASSTVYLGTSPYPYRRTCATNLYAYSRPTLIERRIGTNSNSKSVFIHVIEAYGSTTSGIASVSKLPLTSVSDEYVALSIVFNNGREDVVLINLNNDLITGTAATQTIQTADSVYSLTGKIGVFTNINSSINGYLIKGSKLSYIDNELNIPNHVYTGIISETVRKADGAAYNALVTDAAIPEGDDLKGNWISLRFGTYSVINPPSNITTQSDMNELFKIDGVRVVNGKTYILCNEDHQLSINGNVTTELLRPQRVFNGSTTFKIEKSTTYSNMNGEQNRIISNIRTNTTKKNADLIITPNPITSHFDVKYNLDIDSNVKLTIFNPNGYRVKTLIENQKQLKGNHIKTFEASDLNNGIYFICFRTDKQSKISKIIVNK